MTHRDTKKQRRGQGKGRSGGEEKRVREGQGVSRLGRKVRRMERKGGEGGSKGVVYCCVAQ